MWKKIWSYALFVTVICVYCLSASGDFHEKREREGEGERQERERELLKVDPAQLRLTLTPSEMK